MSRYQALSVANPIVSLEKGARRPDTTLTNAVAVREGDRHSHIR